MKKLLFIMFLLSACTSSDNSVNNTQLTSIDKNPESIPMSYEDMQKQFQSDSSGEALRKSREKERQWLIYKDIYPAVKLSKSLNDFSALDTAQLQRAYLNFRLVMNNYKDSGTTYLPFFKELYESLDNQMEVLEKGNQLDIRDKLRITKLKSNINSAIAAIELKSVTK